MPMDNGFGLNDENCPLPLDPELAQGDLEELAWQTQSRPMLFRGNDRKLLSQSQVLKQEIAARTEAPSTKSDDNAQYSKH